jgi:hypothetical protein
MKNKPQAAQAQIISFRLIPLNTPVSFRWTVPLNLSLKIFLSFSIREVAYYFGSLFLKEFLFLAHVNVMLQYFLLHM